MPVKPEIPFRKQSGNREKRKIGVHDVEERRITASTAIISNKNSMTTARQVNFIGCKCKSQ
jgi:hypothetical protein